MRGHLENYRKFLTPFFVFFWRFAVLVCPLLILVGAYIFVSDPGSSDSAAIIVGNALLTLFGAFVAREWVKL